MKMADASIILWFRRDLRLSDLPMLAQAVASGRALIPVFILDPETEALGAAAKWRLGLSVAAFARALEAVGARLVLRPPDVAERIMSGGYPNMSGAGGVVRSAVAID